jgi:DUF3093 family protein
MTAREVDTTSKTTLGRVSGSPTTARSARYRERLTVPWWWWPPAFVLAALVALEVNRAARDIPGWISFAVLFAIASGVLIWFGRAEVRVVDSADGTPVLWAGPAHLPVDVIGRSAEIPASAKSAAMGRQLDPAAYVLHRPWIRPMVLVVLNDPDDPTPYWLLSSRHPDRVLGALRRDG